MVRTEIDYALVLEVFDGSGTLLASRELTGLPMISGWAFPFTEIHTAHKRVRERVGRHPDRFDQYSADQHQTLGPGQSAGLVATDTLFLAQDGNFREYHAFACMHMF